ncbi:MAG: histidine--tRNA ligase [Anaerolineales bacterium]
MHPISPVKGTRDFFPEQQARRRWLAEKIRAASQAFGYHEYEAPYLERLDLYAARSGEELVREQSFVFQDRGGDWIVLRPELTPSLARMVAMRKSTLALPLRWWAYGPFWRYEKPQKGRSREFWQWNIDLLGIDSPWADAELVAIAAHFFRSVGLGPDRIQISVNDRRLVERQMDSLSIPKDLRPEVLHWIDRRESSHGSQRPEALVGAGLTSRQAEGVRGLLDQRDAWRNSEELAAFFDGISAMGASDYVVYSPSIVRGLDYYTGTVFEARDTTGGLRAILGGGRYDDLVGDVGGERLPGVGFAMGDVVLSLILEETGAFPDLAPAPTQVLVLSFPEVSDAHSVQLAGELRAAGLRAEWYPAQDRVPKQLKYADRNRIPIAALLGPQEVEGGQVTLKDLRGGTQVTIPRAEAAATALAWLAGPATSS